MDGQVDLRTILANPQDKGLLERIEASLKHSARLYRLALTLDQAHGFPCVSPGVTRMTLLTIREMDNLVTDLLKEYDFQTTLLMQEEREPD